MAAEMTHILVCLILSEIIDGREISDQVYNLLEPFASYHEVLEHDEPCICTISSSGPDQSCKLCNGKGVVRTTGNPDTRFDYWVYAGESGDTVKDLLDNSESYDMEQYVAGLGIKGRIDPDSTEDMDMKASLIKVGDIFEDIAHIDAVVTPDGKWHNSDLYDWIVPGGFSYEDQKKEWMKLKGEIFSRYQGHIAVLIGCHV